MNLTPVYVWDFFEERDRLRPLSTWPPGMRAGIPVLRAMLDHYDEETRALIVRVLAYVEHGSIG